MVQAVRQQSNDNNGAGTTTRKERLQGRHGTTTTTTQQRRNPTTNVRSTLIMFLGWLALGLHLYWEKNPVLNLVVDSSSSKPSKTEGEKNKNKKLNRRKFVSYTSSAWERLWLDNVQQWTNEHQICQVLLNDELNVKYMHEFLNLICTSTMAPPNDGWCIMDDEYRPLFYNTKNHTIGGYELFFHEESPFRDQNITSLLGYDDNHKPRPVRPGPEHEHLVSKFVFFDEVTGKEYVEYIEPLVSHLRFPLARCLPTNIWPIPYALFRGYVIPPPTLPSTTKAVYFDAGASSWSSGGGGPSLKYFVNMWNRHGIEFQDIFAYEMTTSIHKFYLDVPSEHKKRTHYRQVAVSSDPADETDDSPFIPHDIEKYLKNHTTDDSDWEDDDYYVFFKLDIDSPLVEQGSVDYLLDHARPGLIHEFAWEHHVQGNYLMKPAWSGPAGFAPQTLKESYDIFLRLRENGIRAHSWV